MNDRRVKLTIARPIVHDELGVDVKRPIHVAEEEDDLLVTAIGRTSDIGLDPCDDLDRAVYLADAGANCQARPGASSASSGNTGAGQQKAASRYSSQQ